MKRFKLLRSVFFVLILILIVAGCSKPAGKSAAPDRPSLEPYDSLYSSLKTALEAKKQGQALSVLKSMKEAVWAESPMILENVRFVKGPDNSYGIYAPKEDDIYGDGEDIYLYLEPAGYAIIKNQAGYYEFGFQADYQLADENGQILLGQMAFAKLPFKSWHQNSEIALTFTYTFTGLKAGKYKLFTTVSDLHSDKRATNEIWFAVR